MSDKPWDTEDWHKAPGVIAKPSETNSALAKRDYTIECQAPSENLIQVVEGYWIWWCSAHHQPLAWCEKARLAEVLTAALDNANQKMKALREIATGVPSKGPYDELLKSL